MLRIVALSDTHGLPPKGYKVPDGDILIHCGDHTAYGTLQEATAALAWLGSLPHERKWLIPGNHDVIANVERSWWAGECETHEIDDVNGILLMQHGLLVYGQAASPAKERSAKVSTRFGAFQYLRETPRDWSGMTPDCDILVTHGPPFGTGDLCDGQHLGCFVLEDAVRSLAPKLHLFGHIHEDRGVWRKGRTLYANVATDYCRWPPMVFEYDENRQRFTHLQ